MEYLILQNGHLLSILIPLVCLMRRVIEFQADYFDRKHEKCLILFSLVFALISTYLAWKFVLSIYFCFVWFGMFTVVLWFLIMINHITYKLFGINNEDSDKLSELDYISFIISLLVGIVLIVIPFTDVMYIISGGESDGKILMVSRVIFVLLGCSYMFMNKIVCTYFLLRYSK